MTEYPRDKILHFLGTMERRAEKTRMKILGEEIPSVRSREFTDNMVELLIYSDTHTIENYLEACLYRTLCNSGKNTHVHEHALYVVYVDEKNQNRWPCVFGETLLDIHVRLPTKEQIHDYWEWHIRCFKKELVVPMLEREIDISLKQMFLEQVLARVYARADMLYAPISTWRKAVEWRPAQFKKHAIEKRQALLRSLSRRKIFLIRSGAPVFMIQALNDEVLYLQAILEAMKD